MAKPILKCQTCKNSVNGTHCTMSIFNPGLQMSEKSREYKKCPKYDKYVAPPPKPEVKKKDEIIDYESLGDFGRFLYKGGHYSFRTGEVL